MTSPTPPLHDLPLFPLQSVLFPGGLLSLRVFETRYLDLVSRCLRERTSFGVVCLNQGTEARQPGAPPERFEAVGTLAQLEEVDTEQVGMLRVRCMGGQRFRGGPAVRDADGLWHTDATLIDADPVLAPTPELSATVVALHNAVAALHAQGQHPFVQPYHWDDAGWVANRWCEILPIPLAAKQKLMELLQPMGRLQLVHEYLRGKGVVGSG